MKKDAKPNNHWEDEAVLNELDERLKNYEDGNVKGISWDEVKKLSKAEKLDRIKQASSDPLFLTDLKEIVDDFDK